MLPAASLGVAVPPPSPPSSPAAGPRGAPLPPYEEGEEGRKGGGVCAASVQAEEGESRGELGWRGPGGEVLAVRGQTPLTGAES